ncbi:uncharacterized protein LOC131640178 [Vicia villosa]|uniref:uncharacterized protein LOC131640178 n=1 Tax=Vicia villosa TaxID=3911 RepID=UPI00273CE4EC|nr:uncharacterized protein LOC131640178 [Vicia villosa]
MAKIKQAARTINALRVGEHTLIDPKAITDHITSYFKILFTSNSAVVQDHLLLDEVIPLVVNGDINYMLTMLPTLMEIENTFWDIVSTDVENATLNFLRTSWFLRNFNANTLVLIPKEPEADFVDKFRPIAMANFKFMIISKIIADRLDRIIPAMISPEQKGFIHGRNIKDCVHLASGVANVMDLKAFGGNLALKIDITKAFDTIE